MVRPLIVLVVAVATAAVLSRPPPAPPPDVDPLLPRSDLVRHAGASYLHLVADYFWIQTLQAVGRATDPESARRVYAYANLVSDLDPGFREVYVFAAAVISWPREDGSYANADLATALLEKGYRNVPDHVLLRILLAYNLSTYFGDHLRAARILEETARLPDAPPYLSGYATRMYSHAGAFENGLALTELMIQEAREPETRAEFERRRDELVLERELTRVEAAAVAFHTREGRWPRSVEELVQARDLPAPATDPFGGAILLGPEGRARSTAAERRLKLFQSDEESR